jgi:hypothetical protein
MLPGPVSIPSLKIEWRRMSGAARLAIVDTVDPDGNEGKNGRDNSKESKTPIVRLIRRRLLLSFVSPRR